MRIEDLILVSVDDHVVEPPDMFERHLPAKHRGDDAFPRVVRTEAGDDVWLYDGRAFPNIGLNAVAGRPREDYGVDPTSFDEMRRGCWDVADRVGDMNANGVLGSLCFPSFPRLCGQVFAEAQDKDVALIALRAYNDWHVESWCGAAPGRFIPLGLVPFWDIELTIQELTRNAERGVKAVSFSENPSKLGFPSLHSDHWDPFWAACQDLEVVPCLHIGSSSTIVVTAPDAPFDVTATLQPMNIVQAAADLVWSPIFRKFPRMKIALSEGGVGWLPYFLDKIDLVYKKQSGWTGQDYGDQLPSEVFRDRIITCFLDDRVTPDVAERAGTQNMTWECDFPHSDSDWPTSPEAALAGTQGLSDDVINAITHENANRLFSFDPFAHRPKEDCTVGALRAEAAAAGVDTELRSMRTRAQTMGVAADAQIGLLVPERN
ncbi:amidohydrolase [Frankia sp. CNm7]|uniref:Amidohydrolase n=1 Tax=Frankia nepalensis TaxID=1836974 RepID=A0A937UL19_9ACTN|nr:amidohydrolase family protein [Frankia nepalensis]MBL7496650.1 amidohydrolase [Frankia nepalensis]MBL7510708.1 amidohydrolase [Frankia nepalensis]MBL7516659.1 amidohydrolase [Frankia nepalensis]MBL7627389.1 amidohydrolase [Frankia nepalensis]